MPGGNWVQQLSGLVVLAGCAYLSAPSKPGLANVPSVREPASNPTRQKPRNKKGELSPEVREFMQLPTNIQRQVLDYARNWIDASFERVD
jgi:hypothetical protein